ncbi:MAG TPA: YncE family protein [Marmoricola sp.]|nr:YncE family protein [Marmoricola sp.]
MTRPVATTRRAAPALAAALLVLAVLAGCGGTPAAQPSKTHSTGSSSASAQDRVATTRPAPPFRHLLPGMPPIEHGAVYAADRAGQVQPSIAKDPAYLYVPNSYGDPKTTVISQRTHKIVRVLHTGTLSQHVTPSWDLRTLYVEASVANQLVAIDPHTGRIEKRIPQIRPYNLYFTPDGKRAVVMAEQDNEIVFDDPHTFKRRAVVTDPSCLGPNHADFSANGRYFIVSCEFSGSLLKVSTLQHKVIGRLQLPPGAKPQDVRLSPTGRDFYVADMGRDKLVRIGWKHFRIAGHTDMPAMPHGIYPSRDGRFLYVSDRGAGEVSVVSVATNKIVDTWTIPGGGSPDMGGLSADGKILWLSGRYDGYVYGWNTRTGKLIAKIFVGGSPHGLLVWPQPGRYSLGHTGNMR